MAKPTTLRLIVAGSRKWPWRQYVFDALDFYTKNYKPKNVEIVCGLAEGPDKWGKEWAILRGARVKEFPADWDGLGRRAGMVRNESMASYGNSLLAFWDGVSHGTNDMIERGLKYQRRVLVIPVIVEPKK